MLSNTSIVCLATEPHSYLLRTARPRIQMVLASVYIEEGLPDLSKCQLRLVNAESWFEPYHNYQCQDHCDPNQA